MRESYLAHHGILGQKWGVRRTQEQLGHLSKQDNKWVKKNADKVTNSAKKAVSQELTAYDRSLLIQPGAYKTNGKVSASVVNAHNKKMAELMNVAVDGLTSPSGKVVQFVAKRGEVGVMLALADEGYDMSQVKNGVWTSGRVAFKKTVLDKA